MTCRGKLRVNPSLCHSTHTMFNIDCLNIDLCPLHSYCSIYQDMTHQIIYYPTNGLNYMNCRIVKNTLKYKICSDMFRFTKEPSWGSQSQCLAKITGMVPLCLSICALSVLKQVGICRHNTGNAHIDRNSGTIPVILARHWLWLPDDGSCVNRNMSEQALYFNVFLTILQFI